MSTFSCPRASGIDFETDKGAKNEIGNAENRYKDKCNHRHGISWTFFDFAAHFGSISEPLSLKSCVRYVLRMLLAFLIGKGGPSPDHLERHGGRCGAARELEACRSESDNLQERCSTHVPLQPVDSGFTRSAHSAGPGSLSLLLLLLWLLLLWLLLLLLLSMGCCVEVSLG